MMSEDAESRDVGSVGDAEEMMEAEEPAISEEEMLSMEQEMMQEEVMAAESAERVPSPEEAMSMEQEMAEFEMSVPEEDVAPPPAEEAMGMPEPIQLVPVPMGAVDASALEAHPLANLLPYMSTNEFADHRKSIELDGLQNPIILFQGMILDGRNRYRACKELGRPIAVFEFVGTEQQALTYVLSSNQHRRNLTPSQRGIVAFDITPGIARDVNRKRIEKLRETLARKAGGECLTISSNTQSEVDRPVSTRAIAADMMGVSENYVEHAKRIKEADAELFEDVRAGRVTIPEAIRRLDGITDDPRTVRAKTVLREVKKLIRDLEEPPAFLDRLEALIAEFAKP